MHYKRPGCHGLGLGDYQQRCEALLGIDNSDSKEPRGIGGDSFNILKTRPIAMLAYIS